MIDSVVRLFVLLPIVIGLLLLIAMLVLGIAAMVSIARAHLSDAARVGWIALALVPIAGPMIWWTTRRGIEGSDR